MTKLDLNTLNSLPTTLCLTNNNSIKPFFSIITPVFNNEKYLNQYFASLFEQTFTNFEIIIINDGSTDNSVDIINKHKSIFRSLTLINQNKPNSGQGISRNNALKIAKGEYILFIDGDDLLLHNNSLKELYTFINQHSSDVIFFGYTKIYGKNTCKPSKKICNLLQNSSISNEKEKVDLLNNKKIGAPWNKAYKNNFLQQHAIVFAEHLKFEDAYFFWQVIVYAQKISFFNHVIYSYRKHNLSTMRKNNKKNLDIINVYALILNLLKKENVLEIYYQAYFYRLLNSFIYLFRKTPFVYKKNFFIKMKYFIIKYNKDIYIDKYKILNIKTKRILKTLNTNRFVYFYLKSVLL